MVGNVLAIQAWGPKSQLQYSSKKLGVAEHF